MRNTKNSKEAQGVRTAQQLQEQFNIATLDLFSNFDYDDIKPSIDYLLLGWIGSDIFDQLNQPKRMATLDFFTRLLDYFEKAEKEKNNQSEIKINLFTETINLNFNHQYKDVKKYLKETFSMFLHSSLSNEIDIRTDVVYRVEVLQEYLKKVYKITRQII